MSNSLIGSNVVTSWGLLRAPQTRLEATQLQELYHRQTFVRCFEKQKRGLLFLMTNIE